MAVELATAYVPILPSMRGIQTKIGKEIQGAWGPVDKSARNAGMSAGRNFASGVGGTVKNVAATIGGVFVADKILGFMGDVVGEAREAQKVGALTAQVIKTTGGAANVTAQQVGDLAAALSAKSGVDDEVIQSGANLLLTFKHVRNEAGKGNDVFNRANAAALDLSKAGFGDLAGTSKQLGKALNDPIKGMSALGRSGVTFTEQQKKQIAAMVEGGNLLGAQKLLLAEVESQVGGAAAATATAGEKFAVSFGNFKESIGTAILPILDSVANAGVNAFAAITPHVEQLIPAIAKAGGIAGSVLGPALSVVGNLITQVIWPAVQNLATSFYAALEPAITAVSGALAGFSGFLSENSSLISAIGTVVTTVAGVIGSVLGAAISVVVGVLSSLIGWLNQNRDVMLALGAAAAVVGAAFAISAVISAFSSALAFARTVIFSAQLAMWALNASMLANPVFLVVAAIAALVAGMVILYNRSETVRNIIQAAWSGIQTAVAAVVDWFQASVMPVLRTVFTAIGTYVRVMFTIYKTVWSAIWSVLKVVIGWVMAVLVPMFKAAWAGIQLQAKVLWTVISFVFNAIKTVIMAVVSFVMSTVVPFLQSAWQRISSGARVLWIAIQLAFQQIKSIVMSVVSAVVGFVVPKFNALKSAVTTVFNAIKTVVTAQINAAKAVLSSIGAVISTVVGFFGKLLAGVKEKVGAVLSFVSGIPGKIVGFFANAASMLLSIGRNIVEGLINGIKSMAGNVVNALLDLLPGPLKSFAGALGINSPSKVFAGFGQNITDGLVQGIGKGSGSVQDAVTKLADVVKAEKKFKPGAASKSYVVAYINAQGALVKAKAAELEGLQVRLDEAINGSVEKNITGLKDLMKVRDDFVSGITSTSFDSMGFLGLGQSFTGTATVAALQKSSDAAVTLAEQFTADIKSLAGKISDDQLKSLAGAGAQTAGALTRALATATPEELANLNAAQARMKSAAQSLGTFANQQFFQTGINTAQGIVDGIQATISKVTDVGTEMAKALIKAVKKQLKVKSPSRVFDSIGGNIGQGLINGVTGMQPDAIAATMGLIPEVSALRSSTSVQSLSSSPVSSTFTQASQSSDGPQDLIFVDMDGQVIGRMRAEANKAIGDVTAALARGRIVNG